MRLSSLLRSSLMPLVFLIITRGAVGQSGQEYPISGTVTDAATGAPIVRALIRAVSASDGAILQDSIFTGANGAFQLTLRLGITVSDEPDVLPTTATYQIDSAYPNPASPSEGRL